MRVQRRRSQSRFAPLLKILLCLVLIVGMAFCIAWVWQTTERAVEEESPPVSADASPPPDPVPDEAVPSVSESAPVPPPEEESEPPEESGEEAPPADKPVFDGAVPESAAVDNRYFDDAIFLGDSISTGIPLYHVADNAAVVAMTGIGPENISTKECIDIGGERRVTVLEAAKAHGERAKVYIMLGGNGLGNSKDAFVAGYRTFLDAVKEQYPKAVIYLQSITPVVEGYVNEIDPTIDNAKIDEYNLEIMALAKQEHVYYLDVAEALKDETGALPAEASPYDGMHFSPEYYARWFAYLKTHTIATEDSK